MLSVLVSCQNKSNTKQLKRQNDITINRVDSLINLSEHLISKENSISLALVYLDSAFQLSLNCGYNNGMVRSAYNLGNSYTVLSNVSKATSNFYVALKNAEIVKDTPNMAKSLMGLGLVMYNMNKWEDAIDYFQKSNLLTANGTKLKYNPLISYLLGLSYLNLNMPEKAHSFISLAKQDAEERKDSMRLLEIRMYLNNVALTKSSNPEILKEYQELLRKFEAKNERIGMSYALQGMAKYYLKVGNSNLAVIEANKSLDIAKNLNVIYPLPSILEVVTEAEYAHGNFQAATQHLKMLQFFKDSVQSMNAASEVALMSAEYEFDKKRVVYDTSIAYQKRKSYISIGIASLLLMVLLMFFYLLKVVSKERKRSDKLLLNILPESTAKELKKYGKAVAKSHKDVTIVFADIKNFTIIASGLSPNIVVLLLDKFFGAFDEIIEKNVMEKIKTIGDAYMFVSGLESSERNNALAAVQACVDLREAISELNKYMHANYGVSFDFRFGVHTGDIVSGVVGIKKYAFDVWGDAVNIAARMESASEAGKINLTSSTYEKIKQFYQCEYRGEIEAKNKGNIKMYFLGEKIH